MCRNRESILMGYATPHSSKSFIRGQACLWISRIDRGLSGKEQKQFTAWLNSDEANYSTMSKLATMWKDDKVQSVLEQSVLNSKADNTPPKSYINQVMAAGLFLTVFAFASFFSTFAPFSDSMSADQTAQVQTFKSAVGEIKTHRLPDGTSIELNTDSMVQVSFSDNHRQIQLVRGEARFDVARDITRPFTVNAGDKSFTALGTIFNVQKSNDSSFELLVTEGKVLISKVDEDLRSVAQVMVGLTDVDLPGTVVFAGEKATIIANEERSVERMSVGQIDRELAWRAKQLIFDGESLATALKEVERYTNVHFIIDDSKLADLKVSGMFKAGDIKGLKHSLDSNFGLQFIAEPNNRIRITQTK